VEAFATDAGDAVNAAPYRLVVRGELDDRFAYLFAGMTMTTSAGNTILTGDVIDQAHLHGLIQRIEELGLELVSVQQEEQAQS
jgi:hypothetical protein